MLNILLNFCFMAKIRMNSKYTGKICYIKDRTLRRLYSAYIFVSNVEKRDNNLFIEFITTSGKNGHMEFSRSKIYKMLTITDDSNMESIFIKNVFK